MNYVIALTCEYIFDEPECITYLNSINTDPEKYEYVYREYKIDDVLNKKSSLKPCKKSVRKLINVHSTDLAEYTNVMKIKFDWNRDRKISNFTPFVQSIPFAAWPNNLSQLTLNDSSIIISYFPSTLTYIHLKDFHNHTLNELPDNLVHLELGGTLDCEISSLPNKLRTLKINHSYTNKLPELPIGLKYLSVGTSYKYYVHLPRRLTHLIWFSPYITPKLNQEVICLKIWNYKNISNNIPDTVRRLCINYNFDCKLILPKQLVHLEIHVYREDFELENKTSVKSHFIKTINNLPHTLQHLRWYSDCRLSILPINLQYLTFDCSNHVLPILSTKLLYLNISGNYNLVLPTLPNTLTHLILGALYNHAICNLPPNLIHLKLSDVFNHKLPILPSTLEYFDSGYCLSHKIYRFPEKLMTLIWRCEMKLPKLPCNLEYLELREYNKHVPMLSSKIKRIMVHRQYKYVHELKTQYRNKVKCII
jgi:hypothetical protein